jgi:CheY-like chemotaxis protein
MDPTQVDQILANLCVNARDAIGNAGKVTIETGTSIFDDAACANHPGLAPGEYVLLSVSDDGCGMNKETLAHIFEPFFTTKGAGVGTGLGLATVYGIVKQNNGFIQVQSEKDCGTTFKIYLPRRGGETVAPQLQPSGKLPKSAGETVLLVEDDLSILAIGRRVLELSGYRVLTANTPSEAMRLAESHAGEIVLLLTDVVMPELNGRELARRLMLRHPALKCLFMSGYTADIIGHHGVLDEGVHFIRKPFSMEELARKVQMALHSSVGT